MAGGATRGALVPSPHRALLRVFPPPRPASARLRSGRGTRGCRVWGRPFRGPWSHPVSGPRGASSLRGPDWAWAGPPRWGAGPSEGLGRGRRRGPAPGRRYPVRGILNFSTLSVKRLWSRRAPLLYSGGGPRGRGRARRVRGPVGPPRSTPGARVVGEGPARSRERERSRRGP